MEPEAKDPPDQTIVIATVDDNERTSGWDLETRADVIPTFSEIINPKKRAYLVALCSTPATGRAAKLAGICVTTPYNWDKENDPLYQEALKLAKECGCRAAETEAWKRATVGTLEDVYGNMGGGQGVGVVGQRYVKSDTMLIFMLKGADPAKYRERYEHSGPEGGPLEITKIERVIVYPKQIGEGDK